MKKPEQSLTRLCLVRWGSGRKPSIAFVVARQWLSKAFWSPFYQITLAEHPMRLRPS